MSDDDLIRRGDALKCCQTQRRGSAVAYEISALPAVSAPHPYSLRPDLQKIVDNAKNAPQWDTERDRMVPVPAPDVAELVVPENSAVTVLIYVEATS